jgi:hypothetical protein
MENPIKILHIDLNWKVTYLVIRKGILIKTPVFLETAIRMLKKIKFDLIIDEPQHKAILTPQTHSAKMKFQWEPTLNGGWGRRAMNHP